MGLFLIIISIQYWEKKKKNTKFKAEHRLRAPQLASVFATILPTDTNTY